VLFLKVLSLNLPPQ